MSSHAILLLSCPDQPGIVAQVSNFIHRNRGNIVDLDEHVDKAENVFFMRLEWELNGFLIPREALDAAVNDLARPYSPLQCALHFTDIRPRAAIFVSRDSHCLYDLLARHEGGELEMEIPLIVSNHEDLRRVADRFEIPYHVFAVNGRDKAQQEAAELRLLRQHRVDTVILARYMQILSSQFVEEMPNQVINIHHSFLPAFVGARPYHQAYDRGVKIVGATSHYVTADLDEGPIIAQDVMAVTHQDTVADLVRKGKDLEKVVLARAVWAHVRRRVLTYRNKTVVFQ